MKYVPLSVAALVDGIIVGVALFITKEGWCLFGLLPLWPIAYFTWKTAVNQTQE